LFFYETLPDAPAMNLRAFIRNNMDAIVDEWEVFAKTLLPVAGTMSSLALRDHCRDILLATVADMQTRETESERAAKAQGHAPQDAGADTAATAHGALRHLSGFDLVQLVAEFRALRASVLALWSRQNSADGAADGMTGDSEIEQIMRFNEAIDQALAASIDSYSMAVTTSRDMFLAVLGHDLRSPLQAISMTGRLLLRPALSESARQAAAMRIGRCSTAMGLLINDLLEFTRTRLGSGIPLARTACDLGAVCTTALETIRVANPEQCFTEQISGDLVISADAPRLHQVLLNLLSNAVQHGDQDKMIALMATRVDDGVEVRVTNFGRPIAPAALSKIFEPLVRAASPEADASEQSKSSMGLGLFIVREIVVGHGGSVTVQSSQDAGTVFTVRLPLAYEASAPV
jgi:signal transduction histidine kinase